MTQLKLCVNCAHLSSRHYGTWCAHHSLGVKVTDGFPDVHPCYRMRDNYRKSPLAKGDGMCGPSAILFEPKLAWWQKLFTRAKPQ